MKKSIFIFIIVLLLSLNLTVQVQAKKIASIDDNFKWPNLLLGSENFYIWDQPLKKIFSIQ